MTLTKRQEATALIFSLNNMRSFYYGEVTFTDEKNGNWNLRERYMPDWKSIQVDCETFVLENLGTEHATRVYRALYPHVHL